MDRELIVKVGGSLIDLPELGLHLRTWLDRLPTRNVLLIPGGGLASDLIRSADRLDHLGEEICHWLALRALTLTAHVLAARLGLATVIENLADRNKVWMSQQWPVLDMHAFARADDSRPDHLPHGWDVTSDSLAARVAIVAGSEELILLKSVDHAANGSWHEAARLAVVDGYFPQVLSAAPQPLRVSVVNFRKRANPGKDHG